MRRSYAADHGNAAGLAMLSLAKFSGWSRAEIRNLTPEAFVGYADAARDRDMDNGE